MGYLFEVGGMEFADLPPEKMATSAACFYECFRIEGNFFSLSVAQSLQNTIQLHGTELYLP